MPNSANTGRRVLARIRKKGLTLVLFGLLVFLSTIAGSTVVIADRRYKINLAILKAARVMSAECYPHDYVCAGMVGNAIYWRVKYASLRLGRVVGAEEIIQQPYQFSGITGGVRVPSVMQAIESTFYFIPVARKAIDGELLDNYPPFVLYARCEVLPEKAWGLRALLRNIILKFEDGHCAVLIDEKTGEGSYFVLPDK